MFKTTTFLSTSTELRKHGLNRETSIKKLFQVSGGLTYSTNAILTITMSHIIKWQPLLFTSTEVF